jgi:glycosyltransferase involved in cell wall biosynthesis
MPKSKKRRPLRIGMYAHNLDVIPAQEMILAHALIAKQLADGLTDRGHQVTFFAPRGSRTKARLQSFDLPALRTGPARRYYLDRDRPERIKFERFYENIFLAEMGRYVTQPSKPFDLLHLHSFEHTAHLTKLGRPTLFTVHEPIDEQLAGMFKQYRGQQNYRLISISDNQRRSLPRAPWLATVFNGVDVRDFKFRAKPGRHLVMAGRMRVEKGPDLGAQAAIKAKVPLKLIGPYQDHGTFDLDGFWGAKVAPLLGKLVTATGFMSPEKMNQEYGKAQALLMPIRWEEPFGLVCLEAMACGTPVIGFRRGSLPEIIEDGVNGFLVDTVDQMAAAIKKIDAIDRAACRRAVEERFSLTRMVDDYENAYYDLLGR